MEELDDEDLLSSENPVDLVLYAAKHALRTKEELQKYRYLRKSMELLADRGWSQGDKRDLMLFLERITNLKDEHLIAEYVEFQRELEKEGKVVYVSLAERHGIKQGIEQGIEQGKRQMAKKLLARQVSVEVVMEVAELSEDEVRDLMNG